MSTDSIKWHAHLSIQEFDQEQTSYAVRRTGLVAPSGADFEHLGIAPARLIEVERNLLTTAGLTRIMSLIIGAGGQAATNTAARIGVGNGGGTAAIGDNDLSASTGSSNRWFQVMDASYPQASGAVATFKSTFASADGNFTWNEWGIDIGTPTVTSGTTVNATLLNHKTSAGAGTKTAGTTRVATATITLS